VNCEWALKGKLKRNEESKIFADGTTYDGKLYTFKETNYQKAFDSLDIMTKVILDRKIVNNSRIITSEIYSPDS